MIKEMRTFLFLLLLPAFLLQCATSNLKEPKRWHEKFRVSAKGDTLTRVSIPLGEIEKFTVDLFANRLGPDSMSFEAKVVFTDSTREEKLYFLLCNQLGPQDYLPVDTILTCNGNGEYEVNLSKEELKKKELVVYMEGVGYLFKG